MKRQEAWSRFNCYNEVKNYCKSCTPETGRSPGCHAHCEKYKKYRQNYDDVKKNERKWKANRWTE